jgi:two-component system cell cycle sensor histidine kinase/response regulator CckA
MMPRSVTLVHLEESPAGTRRLAAVLQAGDLPYEVMGARTEEQLIQALSAGGVDVVLCTCSGRSKEPAALIRRVRGAAPYVPVIALLALEDEALEVEILKAGASDCVPAARLARLGWAVGRAVAERDEWLRRDHVQREINSLEAQLHHAQRLANIARLAGGVAHDFNNLLTVINGCCQLLLRSVPEGDERRELVEPIEQAGARGAELTKRLLSFIRQEPAAMVSISLNDTIRDVQPMLRALLGETVRLSLHLEPALWYVRADPGEMGQVLMNLVTNARDAMPHGGTVTIRTQNLASPLGSHVELVVKDGGCGMTDAVRARIFDPFFTTKQSGEGTGLGLATVHRIVSQSRGEIDVETAAGRGTSMRVRLPRADAIEAGPRAPKTDDAPSVTGHETVLVVEDEVGVREIVCWFLRGGGYTVLEAANADAAEAICRSQQGAIDLLLSDVVLPGVSGPRLAEVLKVRVPGLKTLFISGYPAEASVETGLAAGAFLAKPFSREALLQKVRKVISS